MLSGAITTVGFADACTVTSVDCPCPNTTASFTCSSCDTNPGTNSEYECSCNVSYTCACPNDTVTYNYPSRVNFPGQCYNGQPG